jgi:hypothetical protein
VAELKTKVNRASVAKFLAAIPDEQRRKDCQIVAALMRKVTGAKAEMWGSSIIGFGRHRYVYASGREGDWPPVAFSPRKQALTLYILGCLEGHETALARLGTFKAGKGCLYIQRLSDIDLVVLEGLIRTAVARLKKATKPG